MKINYKKEYEKRERQKAIDKHDNIVLFFSFITTMLCMVGMFATGTPTGLILIGSIFALLLSILTYEVHSIKVAVVFGR